MNGWPTKQECEDALSQGLRLNVLRCPPFPGESDKARIARGMNIAAADITRQVTVADWIDADIARRIYSFVRGNDWRRIIAEGMGMQFRLDTKQE